MKTWKNKITGTEYRIKVSLVGDKVWTGNITSSLSGEEYPLHENLSFRADSKEDAEDIVWLSFLDKIEESVTYRLV